MNAEDGDKAEVRDKKEEIHQDTPIRSGSEQHAEVKEADQFRLDDKLIGAIYEHERGKGSITLDSRLVGQAEQGEREKDRPSTDEQE
jgi:hypothetical protein